MAICYWDARMLWNACLNGISFENTATIGHLALYLYSSEKRFFEKEYRARFPGSAINPLKDYKFGDYSDVFLKEFLNVRTMKVFDASSYEGADMIHDLNHPIPDNLLETFDAVIDCGSLEHVFNFPVAISNLMKLLKVGGSIFITTPSNNLCGHGFFQFSPELMFRVFSKENGFSLKRIVMTESPFPSVEMFPHRSAYEVIDPEIVRGRVGLVSKGSVMMLIEAKKEESVPLFLKAPLQSDYVLLWSGEGSKQVAKTGIKQLLKYIFDQLPLSFRMSISGFRQKRKFSFLNDLYYHKIR